MMDWYKLQHKLFEMDPVDPQQELARLKAAATQQQTEPSKDLIIESYEIKPGSMPLGIDSIRDFAALAGVRIDEKQIKGVAGQARGSDPIPKAEAGRTKHPLKDKLVGEDFASSYKHARDNYNKLSLFRGSGNSGSSASSYGYRSASPATKNSQPDISGNVNHMARLLQISDIQRFSSAVVKASQGSSLTNIEKQLLGEAFEKLLIMQESKKKEVFRSLLGLAPRQASKPTQPTQPTKPTVTSSRTYDNSKQTIKEHLLKLLEDKKLK